MMVATKRIEEQEPAVVDREKQRLSSDLQRVREQIKEQRKIINDARRKITCLDTVLCLKGLTAHAESGLTTSLQIIKECEISIYALESHIAALQNKGKPKPITPFDIRTVLSRQAMAVLTGTRMYPRRLSF